MAKISAYATDAAPHRGNDFAPTYDASAVATKKVALRDFGALPLQGGFAAFNPADATTYYWGPFGHLVPASSSASYIWNIHRAGIITAFSMRLICTPGTAETSTLYIRKNAATDSTITSTFAVSSTIFVYSGLSIAVALNDFIEVKWVAPTWATNPTALVGACQVFLE
jgi:hypothetical protein